jgi:hypothetical protein
MHYNLDYEPMKKTSAYLLGALIGVVIIGAIVAAPRWLREDLGRHKRLIEAVYYTVGFFLFSGYVLWRQRRRNALVYWASLCVLLLLHVLGVFFYSIYVHPILGWQWIVLLLIESYIAVSFVDWSTQRFHRPLSSNVERN